MNDNDMIRRGDAMEAAYEADSLELAQHGGNRIADRIAALPAVTVGVPCTWPSCGHTAKGQCQGTGVRNVSAPDPAVIREAALREAADLADTTFSCSGTNAARIIRDAILALIPKGDANDR